MLMKDVSFWCIVLAIVIIFFVHHILSSFKVVEEIQNQDDFSEPTNINNASDGFMMGYNMVKEMGLNEEATVDGEETVYGEEIVVGEETVSGDGIQTVDAETTSETPPPVNNTPLESEEYKYYPGTLFFGEEDNVKDIFDSSRIDCINELDVENMKDVCKFTPDCEGFVHTKAEGEGPGEACLLRNLNPNKNEIMIKESTMNNYPNAGLYLYQNKNKDGYEYYQGMAETNGVVASDLACNNGVHLTVAQAKYKCNEAIDCNGFFHYNSNGKARTCFKRDADVSQGFKVIPESAMQNANNKDPPHEPGFYVNTIKK